jgi:hypothetical protein
MFTVIVFQALEANQSAVKLEKRFVLNRAIAFVANGQPFKLLFALAFVRFE